MYEVADSAVQFIMIIWMVALGWRLDLTISEVFSNLNDSMILWFYDSMRRDDFLLNLSNKYSFSTEFKDLD